VAVEMTKWTLKIAPETLNYFVKNKFALFAKINLLNQSIWALLVTLQNKIPFTSSLFFEYNKMETTQSNTQPPRLFFGATMMS
jgi:hypothetical protein